MQWAILADASRVLVTCAEHAGANSTTSMTALSHLLPERGDTAANVNADLQRRFNVSLYTDTFFRLLMSATADECWFCLSNPNLAKHLIVAVGGECYLTLPKGQVIPTHGPDSTSKSGISSVPGGGHVLIVPIAHFPTLASLSKDIVDSVAGEIDRYACLLLCERDFGTHLGSDTKMH
jgi:hypothetical protein